MDIIKELDKYSKNRVVNLMKGLLIEIMRMSSLTL